MALFYVPFCSLTVLQNTKCKRCKNTVQQSLYEEGGMSRLRHQLKHPTWTIEEHVLSCASQYCACVVVQN